MANRTTASEVQKIIKTGLSDVDITSLIDFANRMVTTVVGSESLTAQQLKDMETWLTAHMIATTKERQGIIERIGDIWLTFPKNPEAWLESTDYGQAVLFLDTSGAFQKSGLKKASITAIQQIRSTSTFKGSA